MAPGNSNPCDPRTEGLLIARARAMIGRILSRYSGQGAVPAQDADDIGGIVELRLIEKLRRSGPSGNDFVRDIDAYVATVTYNAIHDHLRSRHPNKTRLRNRLRYVLTHDPRFSVWSGFGGIVCGLSSGERSEIISHRVVLEPGRVTRVMRDGDNPGDALAEILSAIRQPVLVDGIVAFTAELWNIADAAPADLSHSVLRDEPVAASQMETRDALQVLWKEIRELRPLQRKALLLNLRDDRGADALSLLLLTGTASLQDVTAALDLTAEELAAIWNELPLPDERIAAMLKLTRQQVVNLRKAARARLRRRTGQ